MGKATSSCQGLLKGQSGWSGRQWLREQSGRSGRQPALPAVGHKYLGLEVGELSAVYTTGPSDIL